MTAGRSSWLRTSKASEEGSAIQKLDRFRLYRQWEGSRGAQQAGAIGGGCRVMGEHHP